MVSFLFSITQVCWHFTLHCLVCFRFSLCLLAHLCRPPASCTASYTTPEFRSLSPCRRCLPGLLLYGLLPLCAGFAHVAAPHLLHFRCIGNPFHAASGSPWLVLCLLLPPRCIASCWPLLQFIGSLPWHLFPRLGFNQTLAHKRKAPLTRPSIRSVSQVKAPPTTPDVGFPDACCPMRSGHPPAGVRPGWATPPAMLANHGHHTAPSVHTPSTVSHLWPPAFRPQPSLTCPSTS